MRRRVLLLIILTVVGMFAINFAAARLVISQSFATLERRYVEKDVSRFLNAVNDELRGLGRTAADWGEWDETFDFIRSRSRAYIKLNLTDAALSTIHVDVVVISDLEGRTVYAKSTGEADARGKRVLADLQGYLAGHPDIILRVHAGVPVAGIALLPSGPILLAVHPVTDSAGTAPIRGSLVFARPLDTEEIMEIAHRLRVSVAVFPLSGPGVPTDVRDALGRITDRAPVHVAPMGRRSVAGYALVRDLEGRPVLAARVDAPRDIMDQGRFALAYISVWLAATGIVVGAVMLLFLERGVISRLQALSSSVLRIGTSQDLSLRTSLGGKDQLAYLGAAINGMLDALERSTAQLRESEARNVAFLAAFPDMLLRLRRDGTLLDYRRPADGSYPALPPGLMGKTLREAVAAYPLVSRETVERALRAMEESAATGVPVVFEFATAGDRFFEARVVAMGAEEAFALVHDVTARKAAEEAERKEILLKEIHHRVKNNLQVISSLLDLQARAAPDPGTARLLRESKDRVRSMSLIHEKLYKSGGAEGVQFSEYVRDLTARLCHSFACTEETVGVEVDVDELSLDMDTAVPLGIIINELLTNALQYAFPDGRKGRVRISLHGAEEKTLLLSVRDDGVGLPAGVDYRSPASLGLRIVSTLAAQLHGTLAIEAGPGTVFTLSFPRP